MRGRHLLLGVAFLALAVAAWADSSQYLPAGSIMGVSLPKTAADAGISWMFKAWTDSPRESPFRDFIRGRAFRSLAVAVMPVASAGGLSVLAVIELDKALQPGDPLLLRAVAGPSGTVKSMTVKETQVSYVETKAEGVDFYAYALKGNTLLLGTSADVVKTALESSSLTGVDAYRTTRDKIGTSGDGFLFAGNSGGQFASFLHPLEKKWGMTLLLSADDLEWMAASFDVVSSNQIRGSLILQGKAGAAIDDVRDDAEFLGEAFKRKFAAEKIDYAGKVAVAGRAATLEFTMTGMEPLWMRLFEKGMLSVIQPGAN